MYWSKRGTILMILSILAILTLLYAVEFDLNKLFINLGFPALIFVMVFAFGLSLMITDSKTTDSSKES